MNRETPNKALENNAPKYKTKTPIFSSREELHKTFAGVLYEADFGTDKPSPWNLNRIAKSLRDMDKRRI